MTQISLNTDANSEDKPRIDSESSGERRPKILIEGIPFLSRYNSLLLHEFQPQLHQIKLIPKTRSKKSIESRSYPILSNPEAKISDIKR